MYTCILIATDGSDLSRKAVASGLQLARITGASVVAVHVVPRYPLGFFEGGMNIATEEVGRIEKQWADAAQALLDQVKVEAGAEGVAVKTVAAQSDLVAESILATAQKHGCDLIVMASHGRHGLKRLLLGSETTHVLTHSQIPVLVLR
ncbi:MAG: universal stress protein [Polaromonas sp.]|nr:universal stress protein [Polaromonas sp.]